MDYVSTDKQHKSEELKQSDVWYYII